VRKQKRFEIVHVFEPGEKRAISYTTVNGKWIEVENALSTPGAVALRDDQAVLLVGSKYGYALFLRDQLEPVKFSGCTACRASPSGDAIGCACWDQGNDLRVTITKFDARGRRLRGDVVSLPGATCSLAGLLFSAEGEQPTPFLSCENGHSILVGGHWTVVDSRPDSDPPADAVLREHRLLKPRAFIP
jgi:hypothetical protein